MTLKEQGWRIYQNSLLRLSLPYKQFIISEAEISVLLKRHKVYFARWTSDFDCGHSTEWWYCIKDETVSLEKLSAKQRYRVNRGLRDMLIRKLQPEELLQYVDELYRVAVDSINEYPAKYRNLPCKDGFRKDLESIDRDVWICIDRETSTVCGYSFCTVQEDMAFLRLVKVMPSFLKKEINAALAYRLCYYYLNERGLKYVCDGERNIRHETNYQDFLVKVLGFRYAYCRLNLVYHPVVKWVVKCFYPLRSIVKRLSKYSSFIYNVYCVLKQEQIVRSFKQ